MREDMCGFEEITQPPDPFEGRPYGPTYVNITVPPPKPDTTGTKQLIVGGKYIAQAWNFSGLSLI